MRPRKGRAEALNELYERFNAERVLEGEPKAEKNKHFNEALVNIALEHEDEVIEEVERRIEGNYPTYDATAAGVD